MSVNSYSGNFSSDAATYIAKKTLMIAMKRLVVYQLADKDPMPKNNSRTYQYTRYERLVLPTQALTEGVTPDDTTMSIATVSAVLDQWGAVIPITDVAIDSVAHPVLQKAISLAAQQAQELVDRELVKVGLSGSSVYYPNVSYTSRSQLTSTDYLASAVIGRVVSIMRDYGAPAYDEGEDLYVGVIDSYAEDDITVDSTFVDAAKYGMIKKLLVNEVGEWKGTRWVRSNTLPTMALLTGGTIAASATSGSLSTSTLYDSKLVLVNGNTGQEVKASAVVSTNTSSNTSINVTPPAVPSGYPSNSKYNLYFGANNGTLYLAQSDLAPSVLVNQGTVPTSGQVAPATPATGFKTHFAIILGKESLGCVELNKITAYLTPATPSDSDPLVQRRKVGWKTDFKAVIKNDNFMARIEFATRNGN